MMRFAAAIAAIALAAGCTPSERRARPSAPTPAAIGAPTARATAIPAPTASAPAETSAERAVAAMLAKVARIHGLPALRPVPAKIVSRQEATRLLIEKTERDVPRPALAAQGELLAALDLIPADYPYLEGLFDLLKKNVAGFYDPEDAAMYLLDDLGDQSLDETLAHELVHALQDQHFDLRGRTKYRQGRLDELTATSCMAEGDAMAAMFEEQNQEVSADALRFAMTASVALSEAGAATPRVLQASLVAPYVDGYRFVRALWEQGGWQRVDQAWRDPPISTEQILHLDKYAAKELPRDVPAPSAKALGPGYAVLDADVGGEQGVRIALEQWTTVARAAQAATGWGGDRYAVFEHGQDASGEGIAVAWTIRFDDEPHARPAAQLLRAHFGGACRVRPDLGPIAWQRRADTIAMVAGPYRRLSGKAARVPGADCALARRWLGEILRN